MFANKKKEGINTFACAVSLYVAETRGTTIKDHEPPLPLIPFGIVAYGFVGQRFLRQLYLLGSLAEFLSPHLYQLLINNFCVDRCVGILLHLMLLNLPQSWPDLSNTVVCFNNLV